MRITGRFSSGHGVFLRQLEMLESLLSAGASAEALVAAIRTLCFPLLAHAETTRACPSATVSPPIASPSK